MALIANQRKIEPTVIQILENIASPTVGSPGTELEFAL